MGYMTIISTTSDLDSCAFNSSDLIFDTQMPGIPEEQLLTYPRKWYVGSAHGCSCGFRQLLGDNFADLGFADPEEWFPENPEDVEATLKLVEVFERIALGGSKLQCIDAWCSDDASAPQLSGNLIVNLSELPRGAFRLIENYSHEIVYQT